MSRYTGPRVKIMRALGVDLPGLSPKTSERRPYPPGQHGQRRRKDTEFGRRLKEKQKLRLNYGLSEAQLRRLFREARRSKGNTGVKLLELLERRLDNVVFRAGFARSIPAARQLINHGHVLVNNRRVDISSFRVSPNHSIAIKDSSAQSQVVTSGLELAAQRRWDTGWLTVDAEQRKATITRLPDETSVPFQVDAQLVIELYAMSA
ncbi:MAG TPA: 30S ribosomal protein S4 [Polyangiales bacterium]